MNTIPRQAPTELPADFGRYRLLKLLGKGGMGSVYLAHDTQLDRQVALKIPLFDGDDGSQVLARFFREARAAAALHHPNICPIHDVGDCDGLPYLTMAYIEGKPLLDFALARPLLPKQSAFLVRKLALALHEAHKRNIIHRDLKPANIMIDKRGEPIIMDFGLARRTKKADPRLTQAGKLLGTPAYMPPEQITGDLDLMGPASDIYSLGVIFYELLAGRLPFAADDMMAMLSRVLMDEPPPPSQFRPDLEPELEAICLKAMAKKVEDRYASMGELAAALFDHLRPRAGNDTAASAAPATPKPAPVKNKNKEPAGIRVSEMGGLRSSAQLQAQLPATRQRDDTKVPRRKKRRKSARRGLPVWAWCGAVAVMMLLFGWLIYSTGNHGSVRIEVNPPAADAEIEINGEGGHRPGEELDLPVGTHHLTVLARHFEPFRERFVIRRGQSERLVVTLQARPKQDGKSGSAEKEGANKSTPGKSEALSTQASAGGRDYVPLFNGKDLTGWKGLPGVWKVDQGVLSATTPAGKKAHATFLVSPQNYRDFELRFEAKVDGGQGGGGVLVRGVPSNDPFLPKGPLVKIGEGWGGWANLLWESTGNPRIPMTQQMQNDVARRVRKDGFNDFAIKCQGKYIAISVNGFTTVDQIWEPLPAQGPIGFQIHFRSGTKAMQFRNVRVKNLTEGADGFVPLFNGKDLAGWQTLPEDKARWEVTNGILTGTGPVGHLYTERKYADFHLRAEARINAGGNSGIYFRTEPRPRFPNGYEAQINSTHPDPARTGSLHPSFDRALPEGQRAKIIVREMLVEPGVWFTQEVIAQGNHIIIKVNGKTTVDFVDRKSLYTKGRFALQQHHDGSVVEFKRIEIKELSSSASSKEFR